MKISGLRKEDYMIKNITFTELKNNLYNGLQEFLSIRNKEDEQVKKQYEMFKEETDKFLYSIKQVHSIYHVKSPEWTWGALCGREGYVIAENDEIIGYKWTRMS